MVVPAVDQAVDQAVDLVDPMAARRVRATLRASLPEARAQALILQQKETVPAAVVFTSVPQTKQQKIAQLTADYKADKVTPSEYHKRRAEILAEP